METIDSSKQYSLRWEKHAFNLAAEAGYFFEDESFLDCTLSAEGQCIDAHKIILSASSSYLSVSGKPSLLKLTLSCFPALLSFLSSRVNESFFILYQSGLCIKDAAITS